MILWITSFVYGSPYTITNRVEWWYQSRDHPVSRLAWYTLRRKSATFFHSSGVTSGPLALMVAPRAAQSFWTFNRLENCRAPLGSPPSPTSLSANDSPGNWSSNAFTEVAGMGCLVRAVFPVPIKVYVLIFFNIGFCIEHRDDGTREGMNGCQPMLPVSSSLRRKSLVFPPTFVSTAAPENATPRALPTHAPRETPSSRENNTLFNRRKGEKQAEDSSAGVSLSW